MNRREFLIKVGQTGLGFFTVIAMGGCGGGGSSPSLILEQRKVQVSLNGDRTKEVSVQDGSSVLDAIKQAFSYRRDAPFENTAALTIIDGIADHWRYRVNGVEPFGFNSNAAQYPITSDCLIELTPVDKSI